MKEKQTKASMVNLKTVLVVGATGATGKQVVKLLLDQGHSVRTIVRSQDRMKSFLKETNTSLQRLQVQEATLLDLSDDQLKAATEGCDAIVSCLGHNMDSFKGVFGKPRRLVTQAVERLSKVVADNETSPKIVLMSSIGVANPNGQDDKRSFGERFLLSIFRNCVPPHADNERAAIYLYDHHRQEAASSTKVEWCVVRPDELVDEEAVTRYDLITKPQGSLFGSGSTSRINVADFMVNLVQDDDVWNEWKFKMPVIYNQKNGVEEQKEQATP